MAKKAVVEGECPGCGLRGALETFVMVLECKVSLRIMGDLPREVAPLAVHYLSLFRPDTSRGVSAQKTARLLGELRDLVATGYVQVDRKVARTCPPRIWAEAIQAMIDNRLGLKLPMPNHNYLRKVAWDKAEELDKSMEAAVRQAEQGHRVSSGERRQASEPVSIADCNPLHALMFDKELPCLDD